MQDSEAKRGQRKVLRSISSPLWRWCAADIAQEEMKKGRRKEGGKEERKDEGPLGLGGIPLAGLSVPSPGTYICNFIRCHFHSVRIKEKSLPGYLPNQEVRAQKTSRSVVVRSKTLQDPQWLSHARGAYELLTFLEDALERPSLIDANNHVTAFSTMWRGRRVTRWRDGLLGTARSFGRHRELCSESKENMAKERSPTSWVEGVGVDITKDFKKRPI